MRGLLERVYDALLYTYPPSMRRTCAAEIRQCARTALAQRGAAAVPRLFVDLVVSVPREWIHASKGAASGWLTDIAYDQRVPIFDVMTFEDRVGELTMPFRLGATLFTAFGLLAVTLAVVGIYGVTTFVAGRRAREIGIRLALGAPRTDVIALVVRQGALPIAVGLAVGIALALALSRTAESLLFQVDPRDPLTLVLVSFALGAVALAASYIPARRAARLDPVAALRQE